MNDYLILGGGNGTLSILDMRKPNQLIHSPYFKCNGIVKSGFSDLFENDIPQAIFTISTNYSNSNLFIGGGPLLSGVSGYFGYVLN